MCICLRINCKNHGTRHLKGCYWFSKFHVEQFFYFFFPSFLGIFKSMDMEFFTFCCLATIFACICLTQHKNLGTGPSRCYYCQKKCPKKDQKRTKNSKKLLFLKLTTLKVYPRLTQLILRHMHMKSIAMQ